MSNNLTAQRFNQTYVFDKSNSLLQYTGFTTDEVRECTHDIIIGIGDEIHPSSKKREFIAVRNKFFAKMNPFSKDAT